MCVRVCEGGGLRRRRCDDGGQQQRAWRHAVAELFFSFDAVEVRENRACLCGWQSVMERRKAVDACESRCGERLGASARWKGSLGVALRCEVGGRRLCKRLGRWSSSSLHGSHCPQH